MKNFKTNLKTVWKYIKIWYYANYSDIRVWRVKYPNGRITRLLEYKEAKELKEIYEGKLYIDYESAWYMV